MTHRHLEKRVVKYHSTCVNSEEIYTEILKNDKAIKGQRSQAENVIKSVYGVLSLPHKNRTTCSLEVITLGSLNILQVNSESLHLKLGVKIPFPPTDKLNHLQGDRTSCCWGLWLHYYIVVLLLQRGALSFLSTIQAMADAMKNMCSQI